MMDFFLSLLTCRLRSIKKKYITKNRKPEKNRKSCIFFLVYTNIVYYFRMLLKI